MKYRLLPPPPPHRIAVYIYVSCNPTERGQTHRRTSLHLHEVLTYFASVAAVRIRIHVPIHQQCVTRAIFFHDNSKGKRGRVVRVRSQISIS